MVVGPCIEVKAVEGDALSSYRDDCYLRTDFAVEPVLVHAEIGRCVTKSDEPSDADAGLCCATRTAPQFARGCTGRARSTVGGQELLEGGESLIAPLREGHARSVPLTEGLRSGLVDGHDGLGFMWFRPFRDELSLRRDDGRPAKNGKRAFRRKFRRNCRRSLAAR